MDRSAFLSCLPFLIPLYTPAWPPSADGRILLGESYDNRTFVLSLELPNDKVRPDDHSTGHTNDEANDAEKSNVCLHLPLFFNVSKAAQRSNRFDTRGEHDPALATVQIAVVEHAEESSSAVYLRIDDHVYALDLRLCKAIEVHPESYRTDDDGESYRHRRVSRPLSLVMDFDDALLRIFRNNLDGCNQDREALALVRSTLSSIQHVVFRGPDGVPPSPSRSSNGHNSSGSTTIDDMAAPHHAPNNSGSKSPIDCEPEPLKSFQQHHNALYDTYAHLDKIQRVLLMPMSAVSSVPNLQGDDSGEAPKVSLTPMMNATAPLMSRAYISESTLLKIEEHHSTLHQRIDENMQEHLAAVIHMTQRTGRRRRSSDGVDDAASKQPKRTLAPGETARAYWDIIAEQKRIVREQHQLFRLPTRG